jgi:hypothetical protein
MTVCTLVFVLWNWMSTLQQHFPIKNTTFCNMMPYYPAEVYIWDKCTASIFGVKESAKKAQKWSHNILLHELANSGINISTFWRNPLPFSSRKNSMIQCSLCRLIRLLSMWCHAAAFFSASGKMNVQSAYALNTWYKDRRTKEWGKPVGPSDPSMGSQISCIILFLVTSVVKLTSFLYDFPFKIHCVECWRFLWLPFTSAPLITLFPVPHPSPLVLNRVNETFYITLFSEPQSPENCSPLLTDHVVASYWTAPTPVFHSITASSPTCPQWDLHVYDTPFHIH